MKSVIGAILAIVAIAAVASSASAQSNEEILRRLDALERSNSKLEKGNARLEMENATLRGRVRRLEGETAVTAAAPGRAMAAVVAPLVGKAPAPTPSGRLAPSVDWGGIHVGIFSGYALGGRWLGDAPDYPHQPVNGWFGGALVGYDFRLPANWIVGVEADIAAADIKQTDNYIDAALTQRLDYLGTLRARLGYGWDHTLVYLTGGLAGGHISITANQYHPGGPGSPPFQATADRFHFGSAIGAGAEWAFLDSAALKIEYLWVNLPQSTYTPTMAPGFGGAQTLQVGWNAHTIKAGVNWMLH